MKKNLNNKGYMLIEIILASALAMGVAFFITELTIKLKNKNDDLLVRTLVYTDQSIIYNTIMKDLYNQDIFDCNYVEQNLNIEKSGNKYIFTYKGFTNIMSEYAELGNLVCTDIPAKKSIYIKIPINVAQLPEEKFDVEIRTIASP